MKKRLLCLVVCLLMVLPVLLTGCAQEETKKKGPNLNTITMLMIKGENTTDAGVDAVERAINELIEPFYDVHVDLQAYTEEEYYSIVDAKIKGTIEEIEKEKAEKEAAKELAEQLKEQGITTLPETTTDETTEGLQTYYDENGDPHYVFPEAGENQIDMFLITDYTKFLEYVNMPSDPEDLETSVLYNMTEKMTETYRNLKKVINPNYMNALTVDGNIYGIPNNHVAGEYTYLLLNKEVCTDELSWAGNEFKTLEELETYFKAVETYCPDVTPLYNLPDPAVLNLTEKFSVVGSYYYDGIASAAGGVPPCNLLQNMDFTAYLTTCNNYRSNGWVEEGGVYAIPTDKTYAAAFLKGGSNIKDTYGEDYYVIEYAAPIVSAENLYAGGYCVTSFTDFPDLCMDIIYKLSTDVEFRNILQYGSENNTYTVDENTGMIVPNTEGEVIWDVNPLHTGNQFIMKQNALMTEQELLLSANNWAQAKTQNATMIISPYANFPLEYVTEETIAKRNEENPKLDEEGNIIEPKPYEYMYTQEILDGLAEYSADVWKRIMEFEEYVNEDGEVITFQTFLASLKTETNNNCFVKQALEAANSDSLSSQYTTWYNAINLM